MVEFKQLNKDEAALLLEAIDKYADPCICCGKPVIGENFGIIHAIGVCCKSILCQSEMVGKIQDDEELNRLPINWRSNKEIINLVKSEKREVAKEIFSCFDAHFCGSNIGAKDKIEKHKLSIFDGDYDLIKKRFSSLIEHSDDKVEQ